MKIEINIPTKLWERIEHSQPKRVIVQALADYLSLHRRDLRLRRWKIAPAESVPAVKTVSFVICGAELRWMRARARDLGLSFEDCVVQAVRLYAGRQTQDVGGFQGEAFFAAETMTEWEGNVPQELYWPAGDRGFTVRRCLRAFFRLHKPPTKAE